MKSESSNDLILGSANTIIIAGECGHGLRRDSEPTKKCSKCGKDLPLSSFSKKAKSADGLQEVCRDCKNAYMREYHQKKREAKLATIEIKEHSLLKVYANPELAKFTPRELMAELKARGFVWEYMIEPQKRVFFHKI